MKILIIGGVAGGSSTAARLRRLNEKAEIIIFEREKNISVASCGIPYFCGEVIKERSELEIMTPLKFEKMLNVEIRTQSNVLKINRNEKTILIKDLQTGREYKENYDKLVLSPGAHPHKPDIMGIDNDKIFTIRTLEDADKVKAQIALKVTKVAVIGAGYIGLEMAENLSHLGLDVTIIQRPAQVLNSSDPEIACQLQNRLEENGIKVIVNNSAQSFENSSDKNKLRINLKDNTLLDVNFAVLVIGVRPENTLAKEAGLKIGETGGILVNENLQTSDKNIYALGDAIEVTDLVSQEAVLIPLAGPANRQGRIVAENICGINSKYKVTQGTSIIKLFNFTVGITGNNEKQLKKYGIKYLKAYAHSFSHATYYPGAAPLTIKLLFAPENGKILGAQATGVDGVDKRIDVIATIIKMNGTVRDLVDLELSYAPQVGSAKDPINIVGMVAENILKNFVKSVYWDEIDSLPQDTFVLDVRADEDFQKVSGSFTNTTRIPLEQLRSRLNELPKNKPILVYCAKGLKSYFASRLLIQNGFNNILNLNGGYLITKQINQIKSQEGIFV